ncbi:uncharacterized protein LOC117126695 [Brassica rapa]|uniref:uncharacterized protein LOC117126695 n=1 Tax=Brassica campestris TaxID=3711 RepID=UPI00142D5F9D|nr:uncharacterized protein LOC117126695 [Brassica rapa]
MTGNRQYFNKIDETISGKVRFEDDSRIDIKGKGSILFLTQNGERKILANVYFIPDLRSIIISLRQATESGCDVRMRSDVLTLHDKDGNLIIRAMRSKNRLYKVLMEIDEACCLKLRGQDDSTRWHATLGHIGVDTMKAMIGKELVTGIPKLKVEEKLVNHVCLQNGVVEKKESNVVRDDRSILKHMEVPNYLWGEAVRHSTYLIIRVGTKTLASQTPYEAYKGRKLSLEHLRIFGSIGYTKTEAPNLKKLDDRSRSLVPLGT